MRPGDGRDVPPPARPWRWLPASCSPPSRDAVAAAPARWNRPDPASRPRSPSDPAAATSWPGCGRADRSSSSAMRRPRRPRTTQARPGRPEHPAESLRRRTRPGPATRPPDPPPPDSGMHGAGQPLRTDPGDRRAGLRSGSRARDTGSPVRGLPRHRRQRAGPQAAAPVYPPTTSRTEYGAYLPRLQPPGSGGTLGRRGRVRGLQPQRRGQPQPGPRITAEEWQRLAQQS